MRKSCSLITSSKILIKQKNKGIQFSVHHLPTGFVREPSLILLFGAWKERNISATDLTQLFCCNLNFLKQRNGISHPIKFAILTKRVNPFKHNVNTLRADPTNWSNTLKRFVSFCRRIVCIWPFCGVESLFTLATMRIW